jgi:hypothetical protein
MALKEGSRFFRPSVAQYTSQFVEEPYPVDELMQEARRDQQKRDMTLGALGEMTEYLQVNADPAHEQYKTELLQNYYGRVDKLASQLSEGANPDQVLSALTKINRDWQTDQRRRELESSFVQGQASDEAVREAREKREYQPRYDVVAGQRQASQERFTPLRFSGLPRYIDPSEDAQRVMGDIARSGRFSDVFDVGETTGTIIGVKEGWEGVTADKVADLARVTAPVFMKTKGGQQLIDDIVAQNPNISNEELTAGVEDFLSRTASTQVGVETTYAEDIDFIPEHITKAGQIAPLPIGKTFLTPNVLAPAVQEIKIGFDDVGNFTKPVLEVPEEGKAPSELKSDVQVIDNFLNKLSDWDKSLLPEGEESRYDEAVSRAKKKYGKNWNRWMDAREYAEGIRRDFPSLAPLADNDVINIHTTAMDKHRTTQDVNLILDNDLMKNFTLNVLGGKEAGDLIESNNFAGRDMYVFDDYGITTGGTLGEVVDELGYKWKGKKGKIKNDSREDFQMLLNDARVVRVGVHPEHEAALYMSMRDKDGRTRLVAVEGNESMKDSFHDAYVLYGMLMKGRGGQHKSSDGVYTYDVETDINPRVQQVDSRILRTNNSTGETYEIDLASMLQYSFMDYERKFITPRE